MIKKKKGRGNQRNLCLIVLAYRFENPISSMEEHIYYLVQEKERQIKYKYLQVCYGL